MPSLFWIAERDTRLRVPGASGAQFVLAIPYRGLTPYRWIVSRVQGDIHVLESRRRPSTEGGVGAGGYEAVTVQIGAGGSGVLDFVMRDPSGATAGERRARLDWTAS